MAVETRTRQPVRQSEVSTTPDNGDVQLKDGKIFVNETRINKLQSQAIRLVILGSGLATGAAVIINGVSQILNR